MNEEILEINEVAEETVLDSSQFVEDNSSSNEAIVLGENYDSELIVLQRIDTRLEHIDSTVQYGVSLFLVFMLVLILHYIYKFFRMFF